MGELKIVEMKSDLIVDAVEQFLRQKKQRNSNTYRNYLVDIEHFFKTVFNKEYQYVSISEFNAGNTDLDGLMTYFDDLFDLVNENGKRVFSNSTINRKQASIKSFLKFMKIKKMYFHDLSDLSEIKNLPKSTVNVAHLSFHSAMEYAEWFRDNEKNKSLEKYLIAKMAIDTGLRASELLNLKWSQFTLEDEYVLLEGVGKGNKKWNEKISHEFYNELLALKSDEDNIFSLKYNDLVRMMNRAKIALGDKNKAISFHSFKKCAVTNAYRITGGDILEAKRKGRHSSLDTTGIYLEAEDYGMTGFISLGNNVEDDLYKKVDNETLVAAIELLGKDFKFILNQKIKTLQ